MPLSVRKQESQAAKKSRIKAIAIVAAAFAATASLNVTLSSFFRPLPRPKRISRMNRAAYTNELLSSGHDGRIQEVLRMQLKPFKVLCTIMRKDWLLFASRHISVEEALAMFLHVVGRGACFRDVEKRYQHSGATVFRYFRAVVGALLALVPTYIQLPSSVEIPAAITSSTKNYPFFQNCIGAIDGTHIAAKVLQEETASFRNRKGFLSQNVMACCDLDNLEFTYVLSGWEGVAHDGHVFNESFNHGFCISKEKYYLGDAGYPLTPYYCLTPYRRVRYHLNEWAKGKKRYLRTISLIAEC
jgi:DDE superfamily endonuclease